MNPIHMICGLAGCHYQKLQPWANFSLHLNKEKFIAFYKTSHQGNAFFFMELGAAICFSSLCCGILLMLFQMQSPTIIFHIFFVLAIIAKGCHFLLQCALSLCAVSFWQFGVRLLLHGLTKCLPGPAIFENCLFSWNGISTNLFGFLHLFLAFSHVTFQQASLKM